MTTGEMFTAETQVAAENENKGRNEFITTDEFDRRGTQFEAGEKKDKLYDDYAAAMRMRDREPLERGSFMRHFFEGGNLEESVMFGCEKNGYLLGCEIDDVFVPTHFAPAGLKGGYRLLKGLVDEEIPTALFITQDLVDTIKKMEGWKVLPIRMKANFRGEEVEKIMVISSWNSLYRLGKHEVTRRTREGVEIIKNKLQETSESIHEFRNKVLAKFRNTDANAQEMDIDEETLAKLRKGLDFEDFEDFEE